MVLVEIKPDEIKAFDALMKDAKVPVLMGYLLGQFRIRIHEATAKENKSLQKKAAREILGNEKKPKNKDTKA